MLNLPRLLWNFVSAVGMRVVSAGVSFAVIVFLARRWDSTTFGEFVTVYTFFLFLQQLPLLGLQIPLTRDIARRPETVSDSGPSAAILAVTVGTALGVTLGIAGELVYPESMQPALWLVGAALVPGALVTLAEVVLIAEERLSRVALLSAAENFIRASVWLALASLGYGVTTLFIALAVLRVAMLVPYFAAKHLRSMLRPAGFKRDAIRNLLARCPTFIGIFVLAAGISRLDVIMLSLLGTLQQVALYSAPYKVYEALLMVPSALALALFPVFARTQAHHSEQEFEELARQLIRVCVTVGLPCAVTIAFLAAPLVSLLFGSPFLPGSLVLVLLAPIPVLFAVEQTLTNVLLARGYDRLDLKVLAWTCGYYFVALAVLIPRMGFRGAAFATASAAVIQLVTRYRIARQRLRMRSMVGIVFRPALAAILMGGVVYALRPASLAVALGGGGVTYLGSLAMLRAVTAAEVRWIRVSLQQPGELR